MYRRIERIWYRYRNWVDAGRWRRYILSGGLIYFADLVDRAEAVNQLSAVTGVHWRTVHRAMWGVPVEDIRAATREAIRGLQTSV